MYVRNKVRLIIIIFVCMVYLLIIIIKKKFCCTRIQNRLSLHAFCACIIRQEREGGSERARFLVESKKARERERGACNQQFEFNLTF
jgi:hypothetical protein